MSFTFDKLKRIKIMKKIGVVLFATFLIYSCEKEKTFPKEPVLETVSFNIKSEFLAEWTFSFTDGDGDLGSDFESDTNYFQKLHLKSPSTFPTDSVLVLAGERLPKINTSGLNKGVEGDITRFIELDFYNLKPTDTVYFSTSVIDQSGRRSNEIRTPRFTLNPTIIYLD